MRRRSTRHHHDGIDENGNETVYSDTNADDSQDEIDEVDLPEESITEQKITETTLTEPQVIEFLKARGLNSLAEAVTSALHDVDTSLDIDEIEEVNDEVAPQSASASNLDVQQEDHVLDETKTLSEEISAPLHVLLHWTVRSADPFRPWLQGPVFVVFVCAVLELRSAGQLDRARHIFYEWYPMFEARHALDLADIEDSLRAEDSAIAPSGSVLGGVLAAEKLRGRHDDPKNLKVPLPQRVEAIQHDEERLEQIISGSAPSMALSKWLNPFMKYTVAMPKTAYAMLIQFLTSAHSLFALAVINSKVKVQIVSEDLLWSTVQALPSNQLGSHTASSHSDISFDGNWFSTKTNQYMKQVCEVDEQMKGSYEAFRQGFGHGQSTRKSVPSSIPWTNVLATALVREAFACRGVHTPTSIESKEGGKKMRNRAMDDTGHLVSPLAQVIVSAALTAKENEDDTGNSLIDFDHLAYCSPDLSHNVQLDTLDMSLPPVYNELAYLPGIGGTSPSELPLPGVLLLASANSARHIDTAGVQRVQLLRLGLYKSICDARSQSGAQTLQDLMRRKHVAHTPWKIDQWIRGISVDHVEEAKPIQSKTVEDASQSNDSTTASGEASLPETLNSQTQLLPYMHMPLDKLLALQMVQRPTAATPPSALCMTVLDGYSLVNCLSFDSNASLMALGCSDHVVRIFDYAGCKPGSSDVLSSCLVGHHCAISSIAASSDGKWLLSGGSNGDIILWAPRFRPSVVTRATNTSDLTDDAPYRWPLCVYNGHKGPVWKLTWCDSIPSLFASAGHDGILYIWSTQSPFPARMCVGHTGDVTCVKFCAQGTHIVSGGADGTVRVWDVSTGDCVAFYKGHSASVSCLTVSPTGEYFVSGSVDGSIKFWSASAATQLGQIRNNTLGGVSSTQERMDRFGRAAPNLPGASTFVRHVPRLRVHPPVHSIRNAHGAPIVDLTFSACQSILYSAGSEGCIRAWSTTLILANAESDPHDAINLALSRLQSIHSNSAKSGSKSMNSRRAKQRARSKVNSKATGNTARSKHRRKSTGGNRSNQSEDGVNASTSRKKGTGQSVKANEPENDNVDDSNIMPRFANRPHVDFSTQFALARIRNQKAIGQNSAPISDRPQLWERPSWRSNLRADAIAAIGTSGTGSKKSLHTVSGQHGQSNQTNAKSSHLLSGAGIPTMSQGVALALAEDRAIARQAVMLKRCLQRTSTVEGLHELVNHLWSPTEMEDLYMSELDESGLCLVEWWTKASNILTLHMTQRNLLVLGAVAVPTCYQSCSSY